MPVDQVTAFYDTVVQDLSGWVCLLEGAVLGMIQLFIDHPTLGLKRSLHSMGQHYFGIG